MLQETIGRESEALLLAASGIEFYEVARDVFEFVFGVSLQFVPSVAAELVEARLLPLFSAIFREFVERMNRHKHDVVALESEFNHLLHSSVDIGAHQAAETPHTMVDVHDIVAHLDLVQFLERQREFATASAVAFEAVFVETVENLVVGEDTQTAFVIHKALVESLFHCGKGDVVAAIAENLAQAFNLLLALGKDENFVTLLEEIAEGFANQVEIFMVDALRREIVFDNGISLARILPRGESDFTERGKTGTEAVEIHHVVHGVAVALVGDERFLRHRLLPYRLDAL